MDDSPDCAAAALDDALVTEAGTAADQRLPPASPPPSAAPTGVHDVPLRDRPLPDAAAWAVWLAGIDIPVQADTAAALETMRADEDAVDANTLGELVATDPLMTLKLLVHACTHRPARVVTDPATVIGELVMMGIAPFFRVFGRQPCIEDRLPAHDPRTTASAFAVQHDDGALAQLQRALNRARRGAGLAQAFALQRDDHHAAAIHQAALLHDFAELLLWCHAPVLAQRIAELQRVDPDLRDSTVQRVVLNAELADIQQALARIWRLPEPLKGRVDDDDDRPARQPEARCAALAARLARRPPGRWHEPAAAGDVRDVAGLLGLTDEEAAALLDRIDR